MEELKFIINEINKHFDTDYNMISFDSLQATELLQVLVNVLHVVNATHELEVSQNKDQAIIVILTALQTIKYVPEKDIDAVEFREGLVMGKRNIIHPILYWILSNAEKVKQRVYFATYVEKVEIPQELLSDPEVEQIVINYDTFIEEFWLSYKENKFEKKNAEESSELQEDTKKMAADMSYLMQRLDMQQEKLKNIPNRESLLASVKAYRREVQQEKKLQGQLKEHNNIITQMGNEIKKLQSTLHQKSSRRPENLDPVQQIIEEVQINKILAETQLPREEEELLNEMQCFEKVAYESEPTLEELETINQEMEELSKSVQILLNKKMALTNTNDDQLLPFRNQTTMISNKKQELTNFIMKIKAKNENILDLINQKSITLREIVGGDILHGDELKIFIANLRERNEIYKKYRSYLQGLQAELGIVTRTFEILRISDPSIENVIKMKKEAPEEDDFVIDDITELKYKCKMLYQEASGKRAESVRIYEEMTQLRSIFNSFNDKYDETKTEFDNATGNILEELTRIEKSIEDSQDEIKKSEDNWKAIYKDIENYEMCLKKYSDLNSSSGGVSAILLQLKEKVSELEREKMELKMKHEHVKCQKSLEQDDLEQLKRIKQMILYKIEGSE